MSDNETYVKFPLPLVDYAPFPLRFVRKIAFDGNGCWNWIGSTWGHPRYKKHKYGQIRVGDKRISAHVFAFQVAHGPLQADLEIDHICQNKLCVNPWHLEAITHRENCRRRSATLRKIRSAVAVILVLISLKIYAPVVREVPMPDRALRKVLIRKPVAFKPHPHVPEYVLIYMDEVLECGHTVQAYPQCDPLVAVRRVCPECQEFLQQKKPAGKVVALAKKETA